MLQLEFSFRTKIKKNSSITKMLISVKVRWDEQFSIVNFILYSEPTLPYKRYRCLYSLFFSAVKYEYIAC